MGDYREKMDSNYKVYVEVTEVRTKDGRLIPVSFLWEDGVRYDIDKVVDIRPAASLKAGGAGMRYTVLIKNQQKFMFLEDDKSGSRWFMERKY